MSENLPPFHLAFPVTDLQAARSFYIDVLGCEEGRSAATWVDFNLYGHQIVAHLVTEQAGAPSRVDYNFVDRHNVPVPHFGLVLAWQDWQQMVERLRGLSVEFRIEPHIRFQGQAGEQATFFILDPSANALEFKTFRNIACLFQKADSGS